MRRGARGRGHRPSGPDGKADDDGCAAGQAPVWGAQVHGERGLELMSGTEPELFPVRRVTPGRDRCSRAGRENDRSAGDAEAAKRRMRRSGPRG